MTFKERLAKLLPKPVGPGLGGVVAAALLVALCALAFLARGGWREASVQQDEAQRFRMQAQAWEEEARVLDAEFARLKQETLHQFGRALTERALRMAAQGRAEEAFLFAGRALGFPGQDVPAEMFPPLTREATPAREQAWLAMSAAGPRMLWESPWGRRQPAGAELSALAPDGRMLATAGQGQIRLWDPANGRLLALLPLTCNAATGLAFAPDGLTLAMGCADGTLHLLDTAAQAADTLGREITAVQAHTGAVAAVAYSPDNALLASAGNDGLAKLWDLSQSPPTLLALLSGHEAALVDATFSPDGRYLATASLDGSARLWDVLLAAYSSATDQGRVQAAVIAVGGPASAVRFTPEGRFLVVGDGAGRVSLWEWAGTGAGQAPRKAALFAGHDAPVTALAVSPLGNELLSADQEGEVCFWSLQRAPLAMDLPQEEALPDIEARSSEPGAEAWVPGDTSLVLEARHAAHAGPVLGAHFSPSGEPAITSGADNTVRFWLPGPDGGEILQHGLGHTGPVTALAAWRASGPPPLPARFAAPGTGLPGPEMPGADLPGEPPPAALPGLMVAVGDADGHLVLRGAESGEFAARLGHHPGGVAALAAARDGSLLLSSGGQSALLWNPASGERVASMDLAAQAGGGAVLDVGENFMAVGLAGGAVRAWPLDVALAGGPGQVFQGPGHDPVRDLALLPGRGLLAVAGGDAGLLLVDTATLALAARLNADQVGNVATVHASPDGRFLVLAGDGAARVLDLDQLDLSSPPWAGGDLDAASAAPLAATASPILRARFGPGNVLALACADGTVLVRTAPAPDKAVSGAPLHLAAHQGAARALAFAAPGLLISGGDDTATRAWDVMRDGQGLLLAATGPGRLLALDGQGERAALAVETVAGAAPNVLVARLDSNEVLAALDTPDDHPPLATTCAAFSQDGALLALGGQEGSLRLADAATGRELALAHEHSMAVRCVAFSPNGRLVATGSEDGSARVWSVPDLEPVHVLRGQDAGVAWAGFSPDSRCLVTGSGNDNPGVLLWDLESETSHALALPGPEPWRTPNADPGARGLVLFAPQDNLLLVLAGPSEARLFRLAGAGQDPRFEPSGQRMVTTSPITGAAFGPGGRSVALATRDGLLRLLHSETGEELLVLDMHGPGLDLLVSAPEAGVLAAGMADSTLRAWGFAEPPRLDPGYVQRFAFSELTLARVALPVTLFGNPGLASFNTLP